MTSESSSQSWFQPFRCRDCGSEVGFRSRRRTLSERYILPLFLLQPVRCGECFRRDYRLIFVQVKDRLSEVSGMIPASPPLRAKPPAVPKRNIA
jgi:hypothetical protein